MAVRIKLIAPVPVPPEGMATVERMLAVRRRVASSETVIDFVNPREGPAALRTMADRFLSAQALLPEVLKAPAQGYNAVIIDCTCDQLYPEAAENLTIPLVPVLHASLHLAAMLCKRFSIVTPMLGQGKMYLRLVELYGLRDKLVSVRERPLDFICGETAEEELISLLLEEGRSALREGARAIVLGCTALTQNRILQEKLEVPVLAPGEVGIKTAEALVKMGLRYI